MVGNSEEASRLAEGLEGEDVALDCRPDGTERAEGPEEIGAMAKALREFERALGDGGPDAVLVVTDSSASVAAVIVATKLGTPVARIEDARGDDAGVNASLIRQLADTRLAPDAAAIVNWLRDTYTERP